MPRLVSNVRFGRKARAGLTLIEVSLAGVIGSILMISMVYTSREMNTATDAVFTESYLQTVARTMGDDIDNTVPFALSQYAQDASNTTITMSKDSTSSPNAEGFIAGNPGDMAEPRLPAGIAALGLQLDTGSFMIASNANGSHASPSPSPTATTSPSPSPSTSSVGTASPSPSPSSGTIGAASPSPSPSTTTTSATATPYATSTSYPSPTYTLTTATAWTTPAPMAPATKPSYTQVTSSNNTTMTLGTWRMRYEDPPANSDTGGTLMYTDRSGNWKDFGSQGTHGMVLDAAFNFGYWTPVVDSASSNYAFSLSSKISENLVQLTTKLGKSDGVPFYLQQIWAPRSTTWSWVTTAISNSGTSSSSSSYYPNGGLFPVAVKQDDLKSAVSGTTTVDVWNPSGPGNIGWVSWDDSNNTPYLDAELTDMADQTFNDHNLTGNTQVKTGSGVSGLPGNKTPGKSVVDGMAASGQEVTAFCYSGYTGQGSNVVYTVGSFAKFQLTQTASDGSTGSDYLKFIGWVDANGNTMPSGYTPF